MSTPPILPVVTPPPPTRAEQWLTERHNAMIVFATIAFLIAAGNISNPIGGHWDSTSIVATPPTAESHEFPTTLQEAGQAIMSTELPVYYKRYLVANYVCAVLSAFIVIVLVTGFPGRHAHWVVGVVMLAFDGLMAFMLFVVFYNVSVINKISTGVSAGVLLIVSAVFIGVLVVYQLFLAVRWFMAPAPAPALYFAV